MIAAAAETSLRTALAGSPSACWSVIADRMHYNGRFYSETPRNVWEAAYLQADGFGRIDRATASDQCWDWSHVRDSSDAAMVDVAVALLAA